MLDPRDIYEIDPQVEAELVAAATEGATGPVLINALRGFVDAGNVGQVAVEHVLGTAEPRRLVTFDVDQLVDYRSKRPTMVFDASTWAEYNAPVLAVDLARDGEGTAFLVLHGSEPDVQWERFVLAVASLVERFRVSLTVGTYGIPMGVPHTRGLSVTSHATTDSLLGVTAPWFGRVTVPASVANLLEFRLGERGHDALGFAVHVPHYLAQSSYPPAAVVALTQVESVTGLDLRTGGLEGAAEEARDEVARQVRESVEVAEVVRGLEEQYDAFVRSSERENLLADAVPIPTAEELGAEFERFLSQRGDGQPG
ncbi:PAC2 family protein [Sanguibacter suaedae]|uniref:PAC2 family protein n=1 Tax=Sanguibacter suaedae TaxID=2795737 RepID=A0A934ICL4_9MICO|nr:PAC2 family protein [Sanguibacter suaedae]MBI9115478.1 PAC2 family protein [Sanguibacter suaedae]